MLISSLSYKKYFINNNSVLYEDPLGDVTLLWLRCVPAQVNEVFTYIINTPYLKYSSNGCNCWVSHTLYFICKYILTETNNSLHLEFGQLQVQWATLIKDNVSNLQIIYEQLSPFHSSAVSEDG